MTDRHLHCVYFKYDDPGSLEGYCLLKQKKLKNGYGAHCDNVVLRPSELLCYFLKHNDYCEDWDRAYEKASKYLDKVGFNNYPKESGMNE